MFKTVVIVYVVSFFVHNLTRDVSFANKHGFMIRFRRRIRPRAIHSLLGGGVARSGMRTVTLNASGGAVHVAAGCHVGRSSPAVSSRVRRFLCRSLGSNGLLNRNAALRVFVSHSGHINNSVVDSRGMNPDVTSSVGASTI